LFVGGWWQGEEECGDLSFWVLKEQERKLTASNLEGKKKKHKNPQNPIRKHLTLIIIIII